MSELILTVAHGAVLLLFGVFLSLAFSGCKISGKFIAVWLMLSAVSGALQLLMMAFLSEEVIWKLYPLVGHLPTVLVLVFVYRRRLASALTAVFTAYLLCQPAKWCGVLIFELTNNRIAEYAVRITVLGAVFALTCLFVVQHLSMLFTKDTRSICIFGIIPAIYYVFDYATTVYTDLQLANNRSVSEFLPFFLAVVFVIFCIVYNKEYEQKADAERKEQLVRITVEQQAKELEAVRRGESELRMLRHDLRMFLNTLAYCIDHGENETARDMVVSYVDRIDGTKTVRFCRFDTVNYIISDFAAKCSAAGVVFTSRVELEELSLDEVMFSSVLSNALDNALNEQEALPTEKRQIKLMLKSSDGKVLLSVRNYVNTPPEFKDGLPQSSKKGHGFGTRSIRYLTERMGGNCRFSVEGDVFVMRVII